MQDRPLALEASSLYAPPASLPYSPMLKSLALLLSSLLFAASAAAAPQTYSFSGVLTDIRNDGAGLSFGTPFMASYTHDDTAQAGSVIEPGRIVFSGGAFSISAGTLALSSGAATELQVFNDWTNTTGGYDNDDGFFVSAWIYDYTPGTSYLIQFDLWDFTGATLDSLSMPSQDQFLQLANYGRFWIRRFEGGVETGLAQGGLQTVSAVPAPASMYLVLAAGVALLLSHQRRQAAA